jgi:4-amino-4-deoxy-L-arabinose transferase-like glycosyltransferase
VNTPTPAIVAQSAVRRLPRWAVVMFGLAYVLPGFWGREPWKTIDMSSLGVMLDLAHGRASWWSPSFMGQTPEAPALLPYWLGAWLIALLPTGLDAAALSRLPHMLMLGLTLACTWKAIELLARSPGAQPVAFAFGGEARSDDYARVMADAGLLALVACLGLAQASHEVTPMATQLCMTSLVFVGLAGLTHPRALPYWAALCLGLLGLSLSGAPTLALSMGACALLVVALDPELAHKMRPLAVLCAVLIGLAVLAHSLGLWQNTWRGLPPHARHWVTLLRLWVWFTWPAWPLVLWSLWVWRHNWCCTRPSRHVALPLVMLMPAALAALLTHQEERALLLMLPFLAALAAFALPTLRRSVSALIDWFTLIFFSGSALIIWLVWLAGMVGWPTRVAANVTRLLPGLDWRFSPWVFGLALLATLTWLALVSWRVGRHRSALWKSLVLPASGATLCWLLLMTLWMPMIDLARSYAPISRNAAALMSHPACVQVLGLTQAQMAALRYHGQMDLDVDGHLSCRWLVVGARQSESFGGSDESRAWRLVQTVRRPTDRHENLVIFERMEAIRP